MVDSSLLPGVWQVSFSAKTSTSHPHHSSNCASVFHNLTCNEPKRASWGECFSSTAGQRRGSSSVRLYGCGIVRLLVRLFNGAKTQFWRLQVVIRIDVETRRSWVWLRKFVGTRSLRIKAVEKKKISLILLPRLIYYSTKTLFSANICSYQYKWTFVFYIMYYIIPKIGIWTHSLRLANSSLVCVFPI